MVAPPPAASPSMKALVLEGKQQEAARRELGMATNPLGEGVPDEPMMVGSMQLRVQYAHRGAPIRTLTCNTRVGLNTSHHPL